MKFQNMPDLKELYEQNREHQMELRKFDKQVLSQLQEIKKRRKQRMKFYTHLDPDKLKSRHMKKLTILSLQ